MEWPFIDRGSIEINTGVSPRKMCSDRRKNHGCGQEKHEGTSSIMFGVGTAAKCCELKQCADRVRWRRPALGSVCSSDYVSSSHWLFPIFLLLRELRYLPHFRCTNCFCFAAERKSHRAVKTSVNSSHDEEALPVCQIRLLRHESKGAWASCFSFRYQGRMCSCRSRISHQRKPT